MKRFKNNKGVTGVDIAVSVSIIVITLGIVMAIYTSYSNKSKEIKRNSVATNLAMTVIENIEATDINDSAITEITPGGKTIDGGYGITDKPKGYTIIAKKIESSDALIKMVAFQIDVIVSYEIEDETKTVTLSTIKKYDNTGEAEKPNMADTKIEGCIPVKYDSDKGGYVKTNVKDTGWYSISSRRFPVVVKIDEEKFGVDATIQLSQADASYVWIPFYGSDGANYRYCDSSGNIIKYVTDTTNISSYKITSDTVTDTNADGNIDITGGQWVTVDSDPHKAIKNLIFSWN